MRVTWHSADHRVFQLLAILLSNALCTASPKFYSHLCRSSLSQTSTARRSCTKPPLKYLRLVSSQFHPSAMFAYWTSAIAPNEKILLTVACGSTGWAGAIASCSTGRHGGKNKQMRENEGGYDGSNASEQWAPPECVSSCHTF